MRLKLLAKQNLLQVDHEHFCFFALYNIKAKKVFKYYISTFGREGGGFLVCTHLAETGGKEKIVENMLM